MDLNPLLCTGKKAIYANFKKCLKDYPVPSAYNLWLRNASLQDWCYQTQGRCSIEPGTINTSYPVKHFSRYFSFLTTLQPSWGKCSFYFTFHVITVRYKFWYIVLYLNLFVLFQHVILGKFNVNCSNPVPWPSWPWMQHKPHPVLLIKTHLKENRNFKERMLALKEFDHFKTIAFHAIISLLAIFTF